MNFAQAIEKLKNELTVLYRVTKEDNMKMKESMRNKTKLLNRIEKLVSGILIDISRGEFPVVKSIYHSKWKNCYFDERLSMKKTNIKQRIIAFKKSKGRPKIVMIVFLLSKIYKLLMTEKTCTRRELYYKNLKIFKSQKQVDDHMKDVSYILKAPPWELGILATSKGLVFGSLTLHLKNGEAIDCSLKGGVAIPSNVSDISSLSSSAELVLLIEKDTTFHRLLEGEPSSRLGSCIIVTGKGFPDASTRMLVCKFWQHLHIPILVLNDADPYGIEIMCVYRFGSATMSPHSGALACPAIRWLGIHPSDIKPLLLDSKSLTTRDVRKINCMMERSYIKENDHIRIQLEILLKGNVKTELEALSNISNNYLIDVYVKSKIVCNEYF